MTEPLTFRAGYMDPVHESPEITAQTTRVVLDGVEYDTMVGTGFSGALIIPRLAEALGVHWLLVRKANDGSHSRYPAEGRLGRRWLFVDDVIATGNTRDRVIEKVKAEAKAREYSTTFVGTYLYYDYGSPAFYPAYTA